MTSTTVFGRSNVIGLTRGASELCAVGSFLDLCTQLGKELLDEPTKLLLSSMMKTGVDDTTGKHAH